VKRKSATPPEEPEKLAYHAHGESYKVFVMKYPGQPSGNG
jgi:hypothetical protein